MKKKKIRVAIIGVGNCASALVQAIELSKQDNNCNKGIIHLTIGGYKPEDIEFSAAFDIDNNKVGLDLAEAIFQKPNNTLNFCKVPKLNIEVYKGKNIDSIGKYTSKVIKESDKPEVNISKILLDTKTDVIINFLPVGSELTTKYYAEESIKGKTSFINCIPVFIASDKSWQEKFKEAKICIIGDDIKSQIGATIIHRMLTKLFSDRGIKIKNTYQLNFGGNNDFLNMQEKERLISKKKSKTQSVQSIIPNKIDDSSIHISPSDYVPFLEDQKHAIIKIEGEGVGGAKISLDLKLEVWDSPNSAGVVIDAIRFAKVAIDNNIYGVLNEASTYYMKHPPIKKDDFEAKKDIELFLDKLS
jgi:myo-inositol-1-phosphate synthase